MENKDRPAFPHHVKDNNNPNRPDIHGMNKREYFAAIALQGLLAAETHTLRHNEKGCIVENKTESPLVQRAVLLADLLLKRLEDAK